MQTRHLLVLKLPYIDPRLLWLRTLDKAQCLAVPAAQPLIDWTWLIVVVTSTDERPLAHVTKRRPLKADHDPSQGTMGAGRNKGYWCAQQNDVSRHGDTEMVSCA